MTPLKNSRHEAFAVALAGGNSVVAAYQAAGFKRDHNNAKRLAARTEVKARVKELKEAIAQELVLNKGMVIRGIASIIEAKPQGEPTYRDKLGALGLAVKVLGMDKVEHKLSSSITIQIYEDELNY